MPQNANDMLKSALTLPEGERVRIATELLASLDGPPDSDWEASWTAELERRDQAARQRGESGDDWSDVRARVLGQLGTK